MGEKSPVPKAKQGYVAQTNHQSQARRVSSADKGERSRPRAGLPYRGLSGSQPGKRSQVLDFHLASFTRSEGGKEHSAGFSYLLNFSLMTAEMGWGKLTNPQFIAVKSPNRLLF